MAIAFVQDFAYNDTDELSTATVTVPVGGVAVGNLLIITHACSSDAINITSITDNSSGGPNSYTVHTSLHDASNNNTLNLASSVITSALASGNVITLSLADGIGGSVHCAEFSGCTGGFDKLASHVTNFSSTYDSTATAATSEADELVYGVMSTRSFSFTINQATGFTEIEEAAVNSQWKYDVQYKIVSSIGAQQFTGTMSGTEANLALVATFKATPVPPVTNEAALRTAHTPVTWRT